MGQSRSHERSHMAARSHFKLADRLQAGIWKSISLPSMSGRQRFKSVPGFIGISQGSLEAVHY